MTLCFYCNQPQEAGDLSLEHVWPDALGGDYLHGIWQTKQVCQRCNHASGMFVDAAFIKSPLVAALRSAGDEYFIDPSRPAEAIIRPGYVGRWPIESTPEGWIAEFWVGHFGMNMAHFHEETEEEVWRSYAGGNPKKAGKASKAGIVYCALTTTNSFWQHSAMVSAQSHFKKARLVALNFDLPKGASRFEQPDWENEKQAQHRPIIEQMLRGEQLELEQVHQQDAGARFLCKLALGVGNGLMGPAFALSEAAADLRQGFREANYQKRAKLPIRGVPLFGSDIELPGALRAAMPGAWQLVLWKIEGALTLLVILPNGSTMSIVISDEASLINPLGRQYDSGQCWITVPAARRAVGPIPLPDVLAHRIGEHKCQPLHDLEALVRDPELLPPRN